MTYEDKQMAKLERYQDLARRHKNLSVSSYEASHKATDGIPFGQPILVGHHSEKAHRKAIDRSWNLMGKSIEEQEKAEYYEYKVSNILNPTSISSDDENALDKLQDKLRVLEDKRFKYKEVNKQARKNKTEQMPSYMLSNLSQNIASVKKRIEHLERLKQVEEIEITSNGITLKVNKEDNRVQLFFPDIPSEEVRTKLKSNGFRWSPYNRCWQRQISEYAIRLTKEFMQ
jgi:hypothetical protein